MLKHTKNSKNSILSTEVYFQKLTTFKISYLWPVQDLPQAGQELVSGFSLNSLIWLDKPKANIE